MVTPEKARWIADQFEKSDHLADKNVAEVLRDLAAQVEALQADAERYRHSIFCEDAAETLYAAVLNNAGDKEAIDKEVDAAPEQS